MKDTYVSPVTALVERAEALGWSCDVDSEDSRIEFSQASPAGEDFSFCAYGNTVEEIVRSIREYKEMLNALAWDDELCGNQRGKIKDSFTLRNKIEEAKAEYQERYGELDWRWKNEGLPYTIQDYHSSKGSVMDFAEDDWQVCKECGFTLDEVCTLCDEERFNSGVDRLTEFLETMPDDMSKEDAVAAVEDFYTWREKLLSVVKKVYSNG